MSVTKQLEEYYPEANIAQYVKYLTDVPDQNYARDSRHAREIAQVVLNDPEHMSSYDSRMEYVRQKRPHLGLANEVRHNFPKLDIYPMDADPSQWHSCVLYWFSTKKHVAYNRATFWIGHPSHDLKTSNNIKVRVDVWKGVINTTVPTPPYIREYRKTSFGLSPTKE